MAQFILNGTTNLNVGPALDSALLKRRDYVAELGRGYRVFTPIVSC